MKIISFNINGIRASIKKGLIQWIKKVNPDILCIQETRISKHQTPIDMLQQIGYESYWSFSKKKGYSGVAILTKKTPEKIIYKTFIPVIDEEGRFISIIYKKYAIINIYIPSGGYMNKRLKFKLNFMNKIFDYIKNFQNKYCSNIILSGDYNICHQNIDIHNPKINNKNSGFLEIETEWLSQLIEYGFIDTFRYMNKKKICYSWWSYKNKSRVKNKGWRIDYNLISQNLKSNIVYANILNNVILSDHAPVILKIKI
jgi:exodeoxyribonuclease-3